MLTLIVLIPSTPVYLWAAVCLPLHRRVHDLDNHLAYVSAPY